MLAPMSTTTFDTFKFVDRLEKAGLSREQAAAIAEAQKESLSEALDATLATKADAVRLETRIDGLETRLQNRIETLELRLTVKLGAFIAAAAGVIIAVLRLPH
ncbi:conserved hypothetical protein [Candidatus Accumulibacter aalborgensis]|uniref:DUF1640 domain-containing protein n=1 Tax=Candidatus Accumulibacter aalborgensis TaxID=1860102 RepID=A0A1A8XJA2_9PROT|nr:DUF1640 domain-containing protein [Candidatus Accumulibacter aalborgensis]SBT04018.1 conserved hypothetical protein [Candidatus Accumulibacter aalborgensis]